MNKKILSFVFISSLLFNSVSYAAIDEVTNKNKELIKENITEEQYSEIEKNIRYSYTNRDLKKALRKVDLENNIQLERPESKQKANKIERVKYLLSTYTNHIYEDNEENKEILDSLNNRIEQAENKKELLKIFQELAQKDNKQQLEVYKKEIREIIEQDQELSETQKENYKNLIDEIKTLDELSRLADSFGEFDIEIQDISEVEFVFKNIIKILKIDSDYEIESFEYLDEKLNEIIEEIALKEKQEKIKERKEELHQEQLEENKNKSETNDENITEQKTQEEEIVQDNIQKQDQDTNVSQNQEDKDFLNKVLNSIFDFFNK